MIQFFQLTNNENKMRRRIGGLDEVKTLKLQKTEKLDENKI